jgi:hypothetical protein
MAMVRDPAFWKRFSTAVHLDEEAQAQASTPGLKHQYVEPPSPALASPDSIPRPSTTNTTTRLFSLSSSTPNTAQQPFASPSAPAPESSITSTTSSTSSAPSKPKRNLPPRRKITKTHTTTTTTEFAPSSVSKQPLYTRRNASQLTLGLSGRPPSRFRFWTSISADPHNRESWLEEQQRKKSKRTCMCWGFWLVFFAFVAGIVVTILLLKSKGII